MKHPQTSAGQAQKDYFAELNSYSSTSAGDPVNK
jgi:hypothetical protein